MEPVWTELVLICETLEVFFMHVRMKQDQLLLPAPAFCLESTEHEVIQSDYIITDPPLLFAAFIFSVSSGFCAALHTHAVQHQAVRHFDLRARLRQHASPPAQHPAQEL